MRKHFPCAGSERSDGKTPTDQRERKKGARSLQKESINQQAGPVDGRSRTTEEGRTTIGLRDDRGTASVMRSKYFCTLTHGRGRDDSKVGSR